MIVLDPVATAIARRVHARTGVRASELYGYAARMLRAGASPEATEETLDMLAAYAAAHDMTIDEVAQDAMHRR